MREHVAYVPVIGSTGITLGLADADERGYYRLNWCGDYPTMQAARSAADELNADLGVTPAEAYAVQVCSMFRPGEFTEVLEWVTRPGGPSLPKER